jgi:putative transposase
MRNRYLTDLSDAEWEYIERHLPTPRAAGGPRRHSLPEILDAIFYIVRSGCAWRSLPHEFPPWKTVHHYFRTWHINGTWEGMHAALRERLRGRTTDRGTRIRFHALLPGPEEPRITALEVAL